jgi:acetyl-CoA carboxylase biotin carboxyl carrier protein
VSLSHDDVERIIHLLNKSHFDELRLEADGIKLDLRRNGAGGAPARALVQAPAPATQVPAAQPAKSVAPAPPAGGLLEVRAPMLGAFYSAPKPGAEPFVTVGSKVAPDTVIGIIEVMKLMNSVAAGFAGEVVEILAKDGDLVEFDQVLLRVRSL